MAVPLSLPNKQYSLLTEPLFPFQVKGRNLFLFFGSAGDGIQGLKMLGMYSTTKLHP
jgi:hypothetical protein